VIDGVASLAQGAPATCLHVPSRGFTVVVK